MSDMPEERGRLALRVGKNRFEAEGPLGWVESMVGQWARVLVARSEEEAAEAEAKEMAGPAPSPSAVDARPGGEGSPPLVAEEAQGETDAYRRVPTDFRPKVNVTLPHFVAMKEARSPLDVLMATAYYHERYLGLERYTAGQLNEAMADLTIWDCSDAAEQLEMAALRGWVEGAEDGHWTLTFGGQGYVHHDMAYQDG